jgi:hypothetical protein
LLRKDLLITIAAGIAGVIIGVLGVAVMQDVATWVFLTVSVILLAVAGLFGRRVTATLGAISSQEQLTAYLVGLLDNSYIYFRNLELPENRSIGLIDGVLLGTHGAWVLQIVSLPGNYICDGDTWYRYTGNSTDELSKKGQKRQRLKDSPTWQVIRGAREVKAWLSVRKLPQVPVHPVVILDKGHVISAKQPSCPVVEQEKLTGFLNEYLLNPTIAGADSKINNDELERIAERLKQSGYLSGESGRLSYG